LNISHSLLRGEVFRVVVVVVVVSFVRDECDWSADVESKKSVCFWYGRTHTKQLLYWRTESGDGKYITRDGFRELFWDSSPYMIDESW